MKTYREVMEAIATVGKQRHCNCALFTARVLDELHGTDQYTATFRRHMVDGLRAFRDADDERLKQVGYEALGRPVPVWDLEVGDAAFLDHGAFGVWIGCGAASVESNGSLIEAPREAAICGWKVP